MDTPSLRSVTPAIDVYIRLAQYPILCDQIRERMRQELFRRGIISQADFEREVKELSIESQRREGMGDGHHQEDESTWHKRRQRIRDYHTDAYFASNLGTALLNQIIKEVLHDQPDPAPTTEMTFNPEIAPWELLFRQGEIYEAMPQPEQEQVQHHLEEIKAVLIRRIISDHLPFIGLARQVMEIADLRHVYQRLIGTGRIGGKAAGMLLGWKILQQTDPDFGPDISQLVAMPDSYFIGSEIIYEYILMNQLDDFLNQKYLPEEEMRAQYPQIVSTFVQGDFPENTVDQLRDFLRRLGQVPLILRSSSLLEDNFSYAFAGRYESCFCPNQGTEEENLRALLDGIRRVFASTFNPEAMLDRRKHGLIDYDERMAVLVQELYGERYGRYFFPAVSGIAYSQNPFCWDESIRPEDGFIRLALGFGTQASTSEGAEQLRDIPLSQPQLRPETSIEAIREKSQHLVDVIDLDENSFKTLPVDAVLRPDYPFLPYVASSERRSELIPIADSDTLSTSDTFVLTFDYLTQDRKFIKLIRTAVSRLEIGYRTPVEMEFVLEIDPNTPTPDYKLHILQCRPLLSKPALL